MRFGRGKVMGKITPGTSWGHCTGGLEPRAAEF